MKKKLYILSTILLSAAALSLSSCLKDPRLVDFTKVGTVVDFPLGGLNYFGSDAITDAPADDANGTIVRQFAVNIASPTIPTSDVTVTLAIDNTLIDSYNAKNSAVQYVAMPSNTFVFTATSVKIPAGQRTAIVSVTFYKNLLDPTLSYMLPIKIVSASDGATVSGNLGIHYYHFIGNDFAGSYDWQFQRYNASDSTSAPLNGSSFAFGTNTAVFLPITPTEFQVNTGYAGGVYTYDVTFTKTGTGASATYSNFVVSFTPESVAAATAGGISLIQPPVFLNPPFDPAGPLTFAQAKKIFHFQYKAHPTADRYLTDWFK